MHKEKSTIKPDSRFRGDDNGLDKNHMYQEQLIQIGLNPKEAEFYENLLILGQANIGQMLNKLPYKRGDVYNIAYSLIKKGLIGEVENNKKKTFVLENPEKLNDLLENKEKEIKNTKETLAQILPEFKISYNSSFDKPGVKQLEGIVGFKKIYSDIIKSKKDLIIFSSTSDRVNKEMSHIIDNNIEKQFQANIQTRALMNASDSSLTMEVVASLKQKNVAIGLIDNNFFKLPAQILVYGNKTVITALKKEIISTVIENEDIAQTLKNIFDYLWSNKNFS